MRQFDIRVHPDINAAFAAPLAEIVIFRQQRIVLDRTHEKPIFLTPERIFVMVQGRITVAVFFQPLEHGAVDHHKPSAGVIDADR